MTYPFKEYLLGLFAVMLVSALAWLAASFSVSGETALDFASSSQEFNAGTYRLRIDSDPANLRAGSNQLTLRLRDAQQMNLVGAQLRVVLETAPANHAADGHKPASLKEFDVIELAGGLYRSDIELPAEGEWPLLIEVKDQQGGHADLILTLATGSGIRVSSATPEAQIRYSCAMHPSVSELEPGSCPLCGMALTPISAPVNVGSGVSHYTCPMHPSVKNAAPGQCPICGMDLASISHQEKSAGALIVDQRRRQLIGLKTAQVTRGELNDRLRLIGEVEYDPEVLTDIAMPFDGKVGRLFVVDEGATVKAGDPLFTVSSPALYHAERDYLKLLKLVEDEDDMDLEDALQRLVSLGLSEQEIDELKKTRKTQAYRTIHAPVGGMVVHHQLVAGQVFWPGDSLMRIAQSADMRVKAAAYESDVIFIAEGMSVSIRLPYTSEEPVKGVIDSISPVLNNHDHSAEVYVDAAWGKRPVLARSYADVLVDISLKDQLLVPEQAVIHSGESRVVFVDQGEGRLQPRKIRTGRRNDVMIQVLEGLEEGELVVTSGNFLLASESKLKSGIDQW